MAKEPTVGLGSLVFALAALLAASPSLGVAGPAQQGVRATELAIITGSESGGPELKAAEILENRILKRSSVAVERAPEQAEKAEALSKT